MRLFVISLKCSPTHAVDSKLDFTPFIFWLVRCYDIEIYRIVGFSFCPVNNNRAIYILREFYYTKQWTEPHVYNNRYYESTDYFDVTELWVSRVR